MPIIPDQLTALFQANDLPAIRAALDAQPELLTAPESALGWPPLHWAAYHGCNGRGDHLREKEVPDAFFSQWAAGRPRSALVEWASTTGLGASGS